AAEVTFLRNLTQYSSFTEYKPFFATDLHRSHRAHKKICVHLWKSVAKRFLNRTLLEPDRASLAAPENPLALTMSKLAR
ncbi:MAG TPA: hypothetical protein PLJ65_11655, partial [Casimicrobium sp.]|nr:hypothetical protein [Casimicrobium sp.]